MYIQTNLLVPIIVCTVYTRAEEMAGAAAEVEVVEEAEVSAAEELEQGGREVWAAASYRCREVLFPTSLLSTFLHRITCRIGRLLNTSFDMYVNILSLKTSYCNYKFMALYGISLCSFMYVCNVQCLVCELSY